jgi:ribosome biogenesis ATPase
MLIGSILQVLCSEMTLDSDVDLRWLAKETPGYVGADLTSLTKAAGTNAVERSFMTMASRPNGDSTSLTNPTSDPNNNGNENGDGDHEMATDPEPETELPLPIPDSGQLLSTLPSPLRDNPLINFVISHPSALSESEVSGFAVSRADFTEALKTVQPSAKREGFATVPNVTWADIGALSTVREELEMAIVEPMKEPETFEAFGINAPSGVLLWGPPGCGKTLLAKAVASESRANFISVKGPELLNKVCLFDNKLGEGLMGST